MIHIYCGDGKGKSTAAMGLALRMAGAGFPVLVGQFFKDGSSSEIAPLRAVPGVTIRHCKTIPGRFGNLTPAQKETVRADYSRYLEQMLSTAPEGGLLVLDEAVSACNHGVIPEARLLRFLKERGEGMEIVLTGRNPSAALENAADYVTEMKKRKHPFDAGIPARFGVEY